MKENVYNSNLHNSEHITALHMSSTSLPPSFPVFRHFNLFILISNLFLKEENNNTTPSTTQLYVPKVKDEVKTEG